MSLHELLAQFLVRLLVSLWSFKSSLSILDNSPLLDVFGKFLLPVCGFPSPSLDTAFHGAEVLNFSEVQLITYIFYRLSRFSPILSFKKFIILHFTFRSLVHFELVLVKV